MNRKNERCFIVSSGINPIRIGAKAVWKEQSNISGVSVELNGIMRLTSNGKKEKVEKGQQT
jgi:hypothetical protein